MGREEEREEREREREREREERERDREADREPLTRREARRIIEVEVDRRLEGWRQRIMSDQSAQLDAAIAEVNQAVADAGSRLQAQITDLQQKVEQGDTIQQEDLDGLHAIASQLQDPGFAQPTAAPTEPTPEPTPAPNEPPAEPAPAPQGPTDEEPVTDVTP